MDDSRRKAIDILYQQPGFADAMWEALRQDPFGRIVSELLSLKNNERATILVAHGMIEAFVDAVIEGRCKNGKRILKDKTGFSHSTKVLILHENGELSDEWFKWLNWFRLLRNDAAHNPMFKLNPDDISKFPKVLREEDWSEEDDEPFKLPRLLLGAFWTLKNDILGPKFSAKAQETMNDSVNAVIGKNQEDRSS